MKKENLINHENSGENGGFELRYFWKIFRNAAKQRSRDDPTQPYQKYTQCTCLAAKNICSDRNHRTD